MSKRKGKTKSTKFTPITHYGAYLPTTGEGGDEAVGVNVKKVISVDMDGHQHPIELNAWEARKLAHGLLKAADVLDGGNLPDPK